ncbi:MAG: hypothetical protein HY428_01740 [Candidatus Levybacteria bacterium]|nr:hypothetical protein [Candidatus Levybacteria bacterium]
MSEPGQGEIQFLPKYNRAAEDSQLRKMLEEINQRLKRESEITVRSAKDIIFNRDLLQIPKPTRTTARRVLAAHYGFADETDPVAASYLEEDLTAAIDYERFGIDPSLPLAEYKKCAISRNFGSI